MFYFGVHTCTADSQISCACCVNLVGIDKFLVKFSLIHCILQISSVMKL